MTNDNITIALFGFSQIERMLIAGICKLSQARTPRSAAGDQPRYDIIDAESSVHADILLVDCDNLDSFQLGAAAFLQRGTAPMILVSKVPRQATQADEYVLLRHKLGGLLLRQLDQIVAQRLRVDMEVEQANTSREPQKTCLVVDDSQLVRTQMEMILGDYPLAVEFAEDAESALQIVKKQSFDLIFLDVMLPEMNGYKACKLIKSDLNTSATPVVMLTSKKSPFNKMHGALVGCDKYLTKPVDPERIRKVLEQYEVIQPAAA